MVNFASYCLICQSGLIHAIAVMVCVSSWSMNNAVLCCSVILFCSERFKTSCGSPFVKLYFKRSIANQLFNLRIFFFCSGFSEFDFHFDSPMKRVWLHFL